MTGARVRLSKLLACLGAVAFAWLIVLPWLARQPAERAGWQSLHQAGIDPSAMYYTELEAMKPILERLNAGQSPTMPTKVHSEFEP